MNKIIESKIKKLQELQAIENQFDESIEDACKNLSDTYLEMREKLEYADKSVSAIIKDYLRRIENAIKELNGTRFERKKKADICNANLVKGGKA